MNRTYLLLRTQIINYFSLNEFRQSGSKKNSTAIMGVAVIILVLFLGAYNILTAKALVQLGEGDLIPAYMVSMSSFGIMMLTMLRSNGILFGSRDMDMLMSLPVKSSAIIGSKFLLMYILNFLIGFVFMVSGGIVWIMNAPLDIIQFLLYFVSMFFVPLIPMCIASLIGILIVIISSHFKNRNVFSLVFSFMALGMIGYIGIFSMQSGNNIENIGAMLAGQITRLYPLSKLFSHGVSQSVSISLGIFIVLSISVYYIFMEFASVRYRMLNDLASTSSRYTSRGKEVIKQQSQFTALYKKEFGRFFSSYMAVLNTGLGVIMLCVFSIILLLVPLEQFGQYTGVEDINGFLSGYAPIIIASMLSLSCTTASSISLEGKNIWILQSSPISVRRILNSKLAVNLTLHAFAYILAVFAIMTRLKLSLLENVTILFIPIAYSLFTVVLGITFNKRYPNYTWENEMVVVKQSIPVILSSVVSMIMVALPVFLHWLLPFPLMQILWAAAVVIFTVSMIMYLRVCKSNRI